MRISYRVVVDVQDGVAKVEIHGHVANGVYTITGRADEAVDGTFPLRQPDDGRPQVTYSSTDHKEV